MKNVISLYKPVSMTPLQAIQEFKRKNPSLEKETISYAGRLDPMAEGLLLLLVGEENKKRKEYENLKKTYEFTVLLGVETDTYDILGKTIQQNNRVKRGYRNTTFDIGNLSFDILESFQGKRLQSYPPYSSRTVQGKPLYWWARENHLAEIQIPKKEIEIYDIRLISQDEITMQDLRFMIEEKISKVSGNFRQEEILHAWENFFEKIGNVISSDSERSHDGISPLRQLADRRNDNVFPLLHCEITCSSGTYVRSIGHELGQKLGTGGIALAIKRTQVEKWTLDDAVII